MKLSINHAIATGILILVSASTMAVDAADSTCSEESGVCICLGSCPSFASGWGASATLSGSCIANKSGENNVSVGNIPMSDGDLITVNDIKYTYPFDACPVSDTTSTGDADVTQTQSDGDTTTTTDDEGDDDTPTDDDGDDDTPTNDDNDGEDFINGVKGKLEFTSDPCEFGTKVQCAVASGPLCKNDMCASTTSTCDDATGGCLSLMGKAEACNKPANICGDGYCGTPPVYENCQCKDNKCYAMKFAPSDGSAPTMEDTRANSSAIMVGYWLVGGAAIIAAAVGW